MSFRLPVNTQEPVQTREQVAPIYRSIVRSYNSAVSGGGDIILINEVVKPGYAYRILSLVYRAARSNDNDQYIELSVRRDPPMNANYIVMKVAPYVAGALYTGTIGLGSSTYDVVINDAPSIFYEHHEGLPNILVTEGMEIRVTAFNMDGLADTIGVYLNYEEIKVV